MTFSTMSTSLNPLDRQLIELLKVNARLPVVKLAKALGCARSTVMLRLKALEESGVITGYTIGVVAPQASTRIRAMVLISNDSENAPDVVKTLSRRHEIHKIYSVSGRYDLCALLTTDSTEELDTVIDRIRGIKGVADTFSTILLSSKLDRPE
jgi:DNA-binding Lrp family transcriptional regulator